MNGFSLAHLLDLTPRRQPRAAVGDLADLTGRPSPARDRLERCSDNSLHIAAEKSDDMGFA